MKFTQVVKVGDGEFLGLGVDGELYALDLVLDEQPFGSARKVDLELVGDDEEEGQEEE